MLKEELIREIEAICPSELAEEWDNCGFQVNCENQDIRKVLVALEVTKAVIEEAEELHADMILTHHPLLFRGIKTVDNNDVIGNYIFRLIRSNISVFSCHTNFDKVAGGNNDYLGKLLGIREITAFDRDNGFCRKGTLAEEMKLSDFAAKVARDLDIDEKQVRYVGNPEKKIKKAAWCTGAGTEFIADASAEGCQVFITGDLKYHDAQMAKEMGMAVIDAGHYGSEKIFTENMAALLKDRTCEKDIVIVSSDKEVDPFI